MLSRLLISILMLCLPFAAAQAKTLSPGSNLQRAIDAALHRSIISLSTGTWRQDISITAQSLTLNGRGADKTILAPKSARIIIDDAAQVTLHSLTLRNTRLIIQSGADVTLINVHLENSGISASQASLTGKAVYIKSARGTAISLDESSLSLATSRIEAQAGLSLNNRSFAQMQECRVETGGTALLIARSSARLIHNIFRSGGSVVHIKQAPTPAPVDPIASLSSAQYCPIARNGVEAISNLLTSHGDAATIVVADKSGGYEGLDNALVNSTSMVYAGADNPCRW